MSEIIPGKFGHGRHLKVSEAGVELRIDIVTGEGTRMEGLVLDENSRYHLVKALASKAQEGRVSEHGTVTMTQPISITRADVTRELFGHGEYMNLTTNERFIVNRHIDLLLKVRDTDDRR